MSAFLVVLFCYQLVASVGAADHSIKYEKIDTCQSSWIQMQQYDKNVQFCPYRCARDPDCDGYLTEDQTCRTYARNGTASSNQIVEMYAEAEDMSQCQYLMTVGSNVQSSPGPELFHFCDGSCLDECHVPGDLPVTMRGATGEFVPGLGPVMCGGYNTVGCYTYDRNTKAWNEEPYNLLQTDDDVKLSFAASVVLDDGRLLVAGGEKSDMTSSDGITEIDPFAKTAKLFEVALPGTRKRHNLVKVDATRIIVANGHPYSSDNVWMYEIGSPGAGWQQLTGSGRWRLGAMTGVVKKSDGRRELVVAGGFMGGLNEPPMIMDLDTLIWRPGPDLPAEFFYGSSVPYWPTFLIVGGIYNTQTSDRIFRYDPDGEELELMGQALEVARNDHVSFLVPVELC